MGPNAQNHGGETALVLYALLHVGQSVQDDPELGPKLRFNSKELEPVVRYVAKIDPSATYTAGLQANALALVPKETPLGRECKPGMEKAKDYLLDAMGADGGVFIHGVRAGGSEGAAGFCGGVEGVCRCPHRQQQEGGG